MASINGGHVDGMAQPSSFAEAEQVYYININDIGLYH